MLAFTCNIGLPKVLEVQGSGAIKDIVKHFNRVQEGLSPKIQTPLIQYTWPELPGEHASAGSE